MQCQNLIHQAGQTTLTSKDLLKDLNKTHKKGQNLLSDTKELLKRIHGKSEEVTCFHFLRL